MIKKILFSFLIIANFKGHAVESTCYGTTANGRLDNGVKLLSYGRNFLSYSIIAEAAGRTYVHSKVRDVIIDAYAQLEKDTPSKVYKYAETGFKNGGLFNTHKTHRNGLSVDFITPVTNPKGESAHLPTVSKNRFGYDIEFDKNDQYKIYSIDYEALAAHIVALDKQAKKTRHRYLASYF